MKMRKGTDGKGHAYYFLWCPGCEETHQLSDAWEFNGDMDSPTFSPSLLVTSGHYVPAFKPGSDCWCTYNEKHPDDPSHFKCHRCHSFIKNGQWEFLADSSHELAGKTVPVVDLPDWLAKD